MRETERLHMPRRFVAPRCPACHCLYYGTNARAFSVRLPPHESGARETYVVTCGSHYCIARTIADGLQVKF